MIKNIDEIDLNGLYSYADYLKWEFDERIELLKGRIFKMSPAPSTSHQKISGKIYTKISNFLNGSTCDVFSAPFDVRLAVNKDIDISNNFRKKTKSLPNGKIMTVVQPDICVICDPDLLDDRGCVGAPDLVIEILSPGNSRLEMKDKFEIYQEAGISEYWIVDPDREFIISYYLNKGIYIGSAPYSSGDTLTSKSIKGFKLELENVFPKPTN